MRVTGKVVRFDEVRGYGFITPDAGGEDVFLHANDLELDKRHARSGARVSFEIEEGERGKFATQVRSSSDGATARPHNTDKDDPDSGSDEYFDVLTADEFLHLVTEKLLRVNPPLNAQQILEVRSSFEQIARKQGLIDS